MSPLRIKILLGYLVVGLLAFYGWDQISAVWRYFGALMAPLVLLIGALVSLKIGVVVMSLSSILLALIKLFFGFVVIVLKPGILKAIIIPQIMSLVTWLHNKSERLQRGFKRVFTYFKTKFTNIMNWWRSQNMLDKALLSGFLIPLFVVLLVVFILERAVALFAVKKLTEQVVQKSTKAVIRNFHRVPVIGGVPSKIKSLTAKGDRRVLSKDVETLKDEII